MDQLTNNQAIQSFIEKHTTRIEQIVDMIEKSEARRLKNDNYKFTEHQRTMTKLDVLFNTIKTMSKFVLSTDILIYSEIKIDKGFITYASKFNRNGLEEFGIQTKVIYAQGPVQCLHLRYLTNCSIPAINAGNKDTSIIKEKIQKLTKLQKLNLAIENFEKQIKKQQEIITANKDLTDDEIHQILLKTDDHHKSFSELTWENHGHTLTGEREFANNKESYESWVQDILSNHISNYKREKLVWPQKNIDGYNREISRLRKKINKLLLN